MKVIIFIYGLFFHYLHIMVKPWKLTGTIFTNIRILEEEPLPKLFKHIISFLKIQILEEHSLAVFADQATRQHYPAALYADSDEINNLNEHSNPVFKQNFNLSILLTGFLTQDIWIIRKDIFDDFIKEFDSAIRSIYAIRMALALYLWKKNHFIYHVPLILSHRTAKVSLHDKNEIIEIIKIFKTELNWQFNVNTHTFPFDINYINYQDPVSLIIPTTLSSETIHQCITKLIKKTSYPKLEIILVISQNKPLTKQQEKFLSSFQ